VGLRLLSGQNLWRRLGLVIDEWLVGTHPALGY